MPNPVSPWDPSPRASVQGPTSTSPTPAAFQTRMFGPNGAYSTNRSTNATNKPTEIERPLIPLPFMGRSAALRLSKRAALLDKRINVHMRPTAEPRPGDNILPELEGTTPIIAELEGDRPVLPELEGSTPSTLYNAVSARVVPANAIKTVEVKAKRMSKRLFSFRPEKVHYDVACTNAAEDIAAAERETKEKKFLVDKINACRKCEKKAPLQMDDELASHAQQHADNLPIHSPTTTHVVIPSPLTPRFSHISAPEADPPRPDTVTTIKSPLDHRLSAARIVSDRGLGAMACVERWYSGKHRRHQYERMDQERHQLDCPCRLHIVYETMMSASFGRIGVGKATEGAGVWVVELA